MAEDIAKNLFKVILGLGLVFAGVVGIYMFRMDVLSLIKGSIGILVGLIGLVFLMLGVSELKG